MNVQRTFLEKSATMAMDFRLFTHNEEVFMNIRQSFNRALLGAVCGALLLVSPASAAEKKIVMRYSHSSSAMVKEPHHAAALDFKNYVEKATNGKVDVQIYPGSQLGGEERSFQDIQQGVIQIASLAVNNVTVFSPSMGVFDLPYMFTNYEDCYKLIDQNWDEINKRMIAESGNMAVGWLVQGFRVLSNSKHPIRTVEPDHDRHLPCVGRRTRAHGVGRNVQRPPAEGRRRAGKPLPRVRFQQVRGSAEVHHRNPL